MIYLELPDNHQRRLPFYLAMEEYVAHRLPADEYLFMWRVAPTVIFGRNQDMSTEVNVDFCRRNGVQMYRRKSGGGCVYADMDNLMISYVAPSETSVADTFSLYTNRMAQLLKSIGVDAVTTERNDLLVGGRKLSGNAFYYLHDRSIVHGTLLFKVDIPTMSQAITPSIAKLESKGVKSVESRVTQLSDHIDISIPQFIAHAKREICDSVMTLTQSDVAEIERIEQTYYDENWISGKHSSRCSDRQISARLPQIGEFKINLSIDGDCVKDIDITGDFFALADIESALIARLRGSRYTRQALTDSLSGMDTSAIVPGLTNEMMINLLFK